VFDTVAGVGEAILNRRLRDARTAYIGAVRRLDHALRRFDDSGMPMDPGPGPEPYPWTREQHSIISAVSSAFREVIVRRTEWDTLRDEYRTPH
jgi:hypothetical protein